MISRQVCPSSTIARVRGMSDLFSFDWKSSGGCRSSGHLRTQWLTRQHLLQTATTLLERADYRYINTPIVEHASLFIRSLGQGSDVVSKELFEVKRFHSDSVDESCVLRPEGTAGVVRALLNHQLDQMLPQRFFYSGPMFRAERPQKGRFRQFDQLGCEQFGIQGPEGDVELILLLYRLFQRLEIDSKVTLLLNSLGDIASQELYRQQLIQFFEPYRMQLSMDSQARLDQGRSLRILDSKHDADRSIVALAPTPILSASSKQRFDLVCQALTDLNIPFQSSSRLVRGLDYYSETVFEFVTQQGQAVAAGGRYDSLVQQLGGKRAVPAMGWALGVDRVVDLICESCEIHDNMKSLVAVVGMDVSFNYILKVVDQLHSKDISCRYALCSTKQLGRTLSSVIASKESGREMATHILLIGPEEYEKGVVQYRKVDESETNFATLDQLWNDNWFAPMKCETTQ